MGRTLAILQLVVLFLLIAQMSWAQTSCPPATVVPPESSADITMEWTNGTTSCAITPADDGAYVKNGWRGYPVDLNYKLHIATWLKGVCRFFTNQPELGCPFATDVARQIGYTHFIDDVEPYPWYAGNVTTNRFFDYDTHITDQSSGPVDFAKDVLGLHTITSETQSTESSCHFPTVIPSNAPLKVNVLQCAPNFRTPPNATTPIVRLQPTTIQVYTPLSGGNLADAITNMISDWNTALSGTGVVLTPATSDCGVGPTCLRILEQLDLPSNICAIAAGSDEGLTVGSDGVITGNAKLFLGFGWSSRDLGPLQQQLAHELGHFFGLRHHDPACSSANSVMASPSTCNDTTMNPHPTINNSLPVKSTVYGGKTQKACGF